MSIADQALKQQIGSGYTYQKQLTISTGTYASGMVMHGLFTVQGASALPGGGGRIDTLTFVGLTTAYGFNLFLLNRDLTTPLGNRDAFSMVTADLPNVLGAIEITGTSYIQPGGGQNLATVKPDLTFKTAATTTAIWCYLVAAAASTGGPNIPYITFNFTHVY